jgi:hypothetical protein
MSTFTFIKTKTFFEGRKDEHYKTYTGLATYDEEENKIRFSKAVIHTIYKNGNTYIVEKDHFYIDKDIVE